MRIPKPNTEQPGASEASAIEANSGNGKIGYDLADLLSRVTADNIHPEQEWGEPRGNEHC